MIQLPSGSGVGGGALQDVPDHLHIHVIAGTALEHQLELVYGAPSLHQVLHRYRDSLVPVALQRDAPEDPVVTAVQRRRIARVLRQAGVIEWVLGLVHAGP